jgi:hypothetical protein
MGLKLIYYGQNDSVNCTPDVLLTGDPGTDQQTLISAGYLGGRIMALAGDPQNAVGVNTVIVPCDVDSTPGVSGTETAKAGIVGPGPYNPNDNYYTSTATTTVAAGNIPFGTLLNGPGEFSGAVGPAGSKKAPIVRALWQGNLNQESYDTNSYALAAYAVGQHIYCGGSNSAHASNVGLYTSSGNYSQTAGNRIPVGICTHVPTTQEPWLGVASLL